MGLTLPTEPVTLDQASLDKIEAIVKKESRRTELKNMNGAALDIVQKFNDRATLNRRSDCEALADSGQCTTGSLNTYWNAYNTLGESAQAELQKMRSWVDGDGTIEDDGDWRTILASPAKMLMVTDVASRRHMCEIMLIHGEGYEDVIAGHLASLKGVAARYVEVLNRIEDAYNNLDGMFGEPEIVEESGGDSPDPFHTEYMACFPAPAGPDCGAEDVRGWEDCGSWGCDTGGLSHEELLAKANERKTKRKNDLREAVIERGGNLSKIREKLEETSNLGRTCGFDVDAWVIGDPNIVDSVCTGLCEGYDGSYTGSSYTAENGPSRYYCKCEMPC